MTPRHHTTPSLTFSCATAAWAGWRYQLKDQGTRLFRKESPVSVVCEEHWCVGYFPITAWPRVFYSSYVEALITACVCVFLKQAVTCLGTAGRRHSALEGRRLESRSRAGRSAPTRVLSLRRGSARSPVPLKQVRLTASHAAAPGSDLRLASLQVIRVIM